MKVLEMLMLTFFTLSLTKFLSTPKMFIMLISLEMSSVFMFFMVCSLSMESKGLSTSMYSIFLILVVCEGVLLLVMMMNIYRAGTATISSTYSLKF